MFDLSGYTALITGASGDIGTAISKDFHSKGADIVITGTNYAKLQMIKSDLQSRCHIITCDLSNREQIKLLFDEAEKKLKRIDILINNAGSNQDKLMVQMNNKEWDNIIEINLTSIFILTRLSLKSMIKRRFGRIINISSVSGIIGNYGQANYSAAKSGLIGMSKSLAQEVASRGITVNCVAPGFIKSSMTLDIKEEKIKEIMLKIPMKKFGEPKDISSICIYLSSKESNYITGQTIHINGGMVMI